MVPWADPRENAFTVSVPEGWNVLGGTYRLSATDTRHCVVLSSPDGQLRVTVGDPNIGGFTVPTPTLSQAGLYEGGVQPLSDGTLIAIRSFRTGCQFAQEWVRAVLPRGWNDLRIVASNDRQDLAAAYAQELRAEGLPHAQVSAGEVAFTGNLNGHDVKGYYVVATHVPFPAQGPSWYVYRIYGHLAPIGRQTEAESICQQVLRSWAFNPQWRAQQRQLSANAVQQDNTRSQQIRSRALQAIAEDQRETSDLIARSYWDRQKTYDEVSRRRSNVNLGTVDVVDPVSGTQYKIGYGADHHWMDDRGNLLGTPTDSTPGVGWRKLITLP
jgi:hypothetical protein